MKNHSMTPTQIRQIVSTAQDRLTALIEPTYTHTSQKVPSRELPLVTTVEHPPLLVQLLNQGKAAQDRISPGSPDRPPMSLEGLAVLQEISAEVRTWTRKFGRGPHGGVGSQITWLRERLPTFRQVHIENLSGDATRWWSLARVTTSWDSRAFTPHVPCPVCAAVGKLRLRTAPISGVCLECQSAWDTQTIGVLGEHVRILMAHERVPASDVVAQVIDAPPMKQMRAIRDNTEYVTLLTGERVPAYLVSLLATTSPKEGTQ